MKPDQPGSLRATMSQPPKLQILREAFSCAHCVYLVILISWPSLHPYTFFENVLYTCLKKQYRQSCDASARVYRCNITYAQFASMRTPQSTIHINVPLPYDWSTHMVRARTFGVNLILSSRIACFCGKAS